MNKYDHFQGTAIPHLKEVDVSRFFPLDLPSCRIYQPPIILPFDTTQSQLLKSGGHYVYHVRWSLCVPPGLTFENTALYLHCVLM